MLAQVCAEMEDYATARSENGQESEHGEAFGARLEALEEVLTSLQEIIANA